MLLVAQLVIASAAARHESRGVHFRRDFPQIDPKQDDHVAIRIGKLATSRRVPAVRFWPSGSGRTRPGGPPGSNGGFVQPANIY